MCRGFRQAPFFTVVGLFLVWRGARLLGVLALVLAAARFYRWYQDPRRRLHARIRADAAAYGATLPWDGVVWSLLETLYLRYLRASESLPQLGAEYDGVLKALWLELRMAESNHDWRRILRRVVDQWPAPWSDGPTARPLDASLHRLKQATRQWREAAREAQSPL